MPALAFLFIVAAEKGCGIYSLGGFALQAQFRLHTALFPLRQGDHAPGVILRRDLFINGQLTGQQIHQTLLHSIALVVSDQFQFHPKYPLLPIA